MKRTKGLSAALLFLTVFGLGWVSASQGTEVLLPPDLTDTDSGCAVFMPGASRADSLVLQPGPEGKDAWVDAGAPDTNHGDSEWFYGMGLLSSRAAFIEFDIETDRYISNRWPQPGMRCPSRGRISPPRCPLRSPIPSVVVSQTGPAIGAVVGHLISAALFSTGQATRNQTSG